MTIEMKPAKLVEVEGEEYVVTRRLDGAGACKHCAFRTAQSCDWKTPQRIFCGDFETLLTPTEYVKQKLKGAVA